MMSKQRRSSTGSGTSGRHLCLLSCLLLCLGVAAADGPPPATAPIPTVEEIDAAYAPAVCTISLAGAGDRAYGGTGFFVAPSRLVTNWHVLADAREAVAVLDGATRYPITGYLAKDEANDLVVATIAGAHDRLVELGSTAGLHRGDPLIVIGSPLGFHRSLARGTLANRWGGADGPAPAVADFAGRDLLQVSAPISPGSSGSPVFAADGTVVGIIVSTVAGGQNLNFAVPVEKLAALLERGPKRRPLPGATGRGWSLLINLLVSALVLGLLVLLLRMLPR